MESLVIELVHIFFWFWRWKKFENWWIFDGVTRRTKMCHFLGNPAQQSLYVTHGLYDTTPAATFPAAGLFISQLNW